jgi:precorrin-6Y C5,15-methyltransferase (decarboxylating)
MIHVIGLGLCPDHISPSARQLIDSADILTGGKRQLAMFPLARGKRHPLVPNLDQTLEMLDREDRTGACVVVLAHGDPLTYGIGTTLVRRLGRDRVRVLPNVSAPQTAAARLGRGLGDLHLVSLHGRNDWAPLFACLTHHPLTGIFTDTENSPARIARACMDQGMGHADVSPCVFHVFENLNDSQEQYARLTLEEAATIENASLSFVIIEQPDFRPPWFGRPDSDFVHERGLITKSVVRAAGIAALGLKPDSLLWDLGAGCGSVSIEAATLLRQGRIFAVEAKAHRVAMIRENICKNRAWLVKPVQGEMPEALDDLPDPDRIFMGGGARDPRSLKTGLARLKPGGRMVIHAILLETLETVRTTLNDHGMTWSLTQLAGSLSDPVAGATRLKPLNPVFIIRADKPERS